MRKTIWIAEGRVTPGRTVVVVADVGQGSVSIEEETSASSQMVYCGTSELKDALNVHSDEELMNELEKRFGNACGYDIARNFMEAQGIEYDWWGGSC